MVAAVHLETVDLRSVAEGWRERTANKAHVKQLWLLFSLWAFSAWQKNFIFSGTWPPLFTVYLSLSGVIYSQQIQSFFCCSLEVQGCFRKGQKQTMSGMWGYIHIDFWHPEGLLNVKLGAVQLNVSTVLKRWNIQKRWTCSVTIVEKIKFLQWNVHCGLIGVFYVIHLFVEIISTVAHHKVL